MPLSRDAQRAVDQFAKTVVTPEDLENATKVRQAIRHDWKPVGSSSSSGTTIVGGNPSSVMTPRGLYPGSLTAVTALASGSVGFLYLGTAMSVMSSCELLVNVVTAGSGITWAEFAIFIGPVPANRGNAELYLVGFTDVSGIVNSTGRKTVGVSVGSVNPGDDMWVAYGSSATTPFQLRGMLADDIQTGVFQSASVQPQWADAPQVTAIVGPTVVPAWIVAHVE